jgi:hypothetical protein
MIWVTIHQTTPEEPMQRFIIQVVPVDRDDVNLAASAPIRVVPNGFRSEYFAATWSNGRKQEVYLSLSTQLNRSLPLELTLLDAVTGNPVDPELLHVALYPPAPTVLPRGTALFEVQVSLLSIEIQDNSFILKIQCPDAEADLPPFFSRPIRVAKESVRNSQDLRRLLDGSLHRLVVPLLQNILHHVTQIPTTPSEVHSAPILS